MIRQDLIKYLSFDTLAALYAVSLRDEEVAYVKENKCWYSSDGITISRMTTNNYWTVEDQVDFTASEPGAPTVGQVYVNTIAGSSSITAQSLSAFSLVEWNGTDWNETLAIDGMILYDKNSNKLYHFSGSGWTVIDPTGFIDYGSVVSDNDQGTGHYGIDSSGGAFTFTLPSDTPTIGIRFFTNDDVQSNLATLAVASGEYLNGILNGTFSFDAYDDGTQFIVTSTGAGEWICSIIGAFTPSPTVLTDSYLFVGNGINVATGVPLTGEASINNTGVITLNNASVIAKVLTGYAATSGDITAADSLLTAIQKIDGNTDNILSILGASQGDVTLGVFSGITIPDNVSVPTALQSIETSLETKLSGSLLSSYIFVGNGSNLATGVALSGEATINSSGVMTLVNSAVIGKVLTGYSPSAGVVVGADSILTAFNKIGGQQVAITSQLGTAVGDLNFGPFTGTLFTTGLSAKALFQEAETAIEGKLTNTLADSYIFVGNGSNLAIGVAMTGEVTITNAGVTTVGNSAVIGKVLTGLNVSLSSAVVATDDILTAFGKLQGQLSNLDSAITLEGTWDASTGLFPGGGTAQAGYSYIVSVSGTVDGVDFTAGDRIVAILDNASTGTYAANWHILDYTDKVSSVAGMVGAVTLTTNNVTEASNLYFTNARVLATALTGYVSGAGTITSSDSILQAIQKLNGNIGAIKTIYSANDTLASTRTISLGNNNLIFDGAANTGVIQINNTSGANPFTILSGTHTMNFYGNGSGGFDIVQDSDFANTSYGYDGISFFQDFGSGGNRVSLKTPSAVISSSFDLFLPIADGSAGYLLSTNGAGQLSFVAPGLTTTLTSGNIFVGNGSNIATSVAMSGQATISNAGVVTLANSAVIAKVLTGFSAGAGTITATDSILQAIQKLSGNISAIKTIYSADDTLAGARVVSLGNNLLTFDGAANTGAVLINNTSGVNPFTVLSSTHVVNFYGDTIGGLDIVKLSDFAGTVYAHDGIKFTQTFGLGNKSVSLKTPTGSSIASDFSLYLPVADGSSGQAVITNGAGQLSFGSFQSTALTSGNILVGNGSNVAASVTMSGGATISNTGVVTLSNASVISKVLTGFSSGAGTVSASDSILQAIQKIVGNIAAIKTIYTADDTLTSTRVVSLGNNNLTFDGAANLGGVIINNTSGVNPFTVSSSTHSMNFYGDGSGGFDIIRQSDFANTSYGHDTISFFQDIGSGGHRVTLATPPAAISSNFTLYLPIADGSSGQAIITNGAGQLSFASILTANLYSADGDLAGDRIISFDGNDFTLNGAAPGDGSFKVNAIFDQQFTSGTVTTSMDSQGTQILATVSDSSDSDNAYLQINQNLAALNAIDVASLPTVNNSFIRAGAGSSAPSFEGRAGNTIGASSAYTHIYGERDNLLLKLVGDSSEAASVILETDGTDAKVVIEGSALELPSRTTANRGSSPVEGDIAYNSTTTQIEIYQKGNWVSIDPTKDFSLIIVTPGTDVDTVGDGAAYAMVPPGINGDVVEIFARFETIGSGTSGTTQIQVARNRAGTYVDMCSTLVTIDADELDTTTAATAVVINTSNDDVVTGDIIRIDLDGVATGGTLPTGLFIGFKVRQTT